MPEDVIDRDRIHTNVMLYWLTGRAASTANLYYESMHFAAMEVPDLLIGDVREFFRTLR